MSRNDPPLVLAKVDAVEEVNKELASQYEVNGYPTIKILRNGGKTIQDFKGSRESADTIVAYVKKQSGPASLELKTAEDASRLTSDKKIGIVTSQFHLFLSLTRICVLNGVLKGMIITACPCRLVCSQNSLERSLTSL